MICMKVYLYFHVLCTCDNAYIIGGSSMYPGLPSRLEKDLKERYLKDVLKGRSAYTFILMPS